MKKILSALQGNTHDIPPVWLMRQAGRFLPEYRELRAELGSFLNLCYSPKDASEVTLQPVRRFDMDAAIIFSDILVIPDGLGLNVDFVKGEGPKLQQITSMVDVNKLDVDAVVPHLNPVFEALKLTKSALKDHQTLIGFAGAPWTVSTYMIEGGGSKAFETTKRFTFEQKSAYEALLEILVESTSRYLIAQVEAGAEVLQLFDSWSGVLSETDFYAYCILPAKQIVENVKKVHPDIPIIGFPKGAGLLIEKYIKNVPVDGVSIDYTVPVAWAAKNLQPHVCVQGNIDPLLVACAKERIVDEVNRIKNELSGGAYIFNLGHGIVPYTPIENVELLINTVRGK